ncbi:MAG: phospholipid carrier-dependent glycosyltransferase, partial [Candidatus Omnitrophica bacterium]|nr:phospholipid carrier-dependent glycosyltransferase [Candidatus Omnitrophota bacterium]
MILMAEESDGSPAKEQKRISPWLCVFVGIAIVLGIYFRFYQITANRFIFYDEGMWVLQNHEFVELIERSQGQPMTVQAKLLNGMFHLSLRTGKALWSFLSMARGFFTGAEGYAFTRIISAMLGALTVGVTFMFARRFYQSTAAGLLSAALLAVLPSHVFYSRIALQEAYSAFFFLVGLYLYLFPRKMSVRTFLASLCFASVFFVNYRMIIIPFLVGVCEVYLSLADKRRPDLGKWACHTGLFLMLVFGVGALDGGANTRVTFGWMFHQSQLAKGTFSVINLFSYPYYVLTFEGALFALAFAANGYFLWKRRWREAFPFILVITFMAVFSLPQEKGARHLASALPFMGMAVAWAICQVGSRRLSGRRGRIILAGVVVAMGGWQVRESYFISRFDNAYQPAIEHIREHDPAAKFVSTQSMVQKLYVADKKDVTEFKYSMAYLVYL